MRDNSCNKWDSKKLKNKNLKFKERKYDLQKLNIGN